MADKFRVDVDTSEADEGIRSAEERMRREGESERYYRGRLGSWASRLADSPKEREEYGRSADEAHRRMTEASREGMQLRRGRGKARELAERLKGAGSASRRRSSKRSK